MVSGQRFAILAMFFLTGPPPPQKKKIYVQDSMLNAVKFLLNSGDIKGFCTQKIKRRGVQLKKRHPVWLSLLFREPKMAAAWRARQDCLSCSVPQEVCETSVSCSGSPILKRDLVTSVKMLCTSGSCNQSGFLHASCLQQVEDILIRQVSNNSAGSFANLTAAKLQRKSYNWKNPADREKLWKDGGGGHMYSLICRKVKCRCGRGLVRRDLTWPPTQWRGGAKKVPALPMSSRSAAPTVRVCGQGSIQYQPAVAQLPDFVRESGHVGIPGAVFHIPGEKSKQGVIIKWVGGREADLPSVVYPIQWWS